jgi:pimeloyl-ACP methyl ester carboxylesterase
MSAFICYDAFRMHRFVETNGIRMHIAEAGGGPLVVLLHGFPECWYSWRHQLEAIAAAGYHVVAPDMRGCGQTDQPEPLDAYDIFQLTGDIAGLVNVLGGAPAVIAGHDWGAWIAPHCALLRPDLFRAVALLSVPFVPRRDVNETQWEQRKYPGKIFYQAVLRSAMSDQIFGADPRNRLLSGLWTLSGDIPREHRWKPVMDGPPVPPQLPEGLPPWLAEEDLDYMAGEFRRTGFTGGLNYYRNMDRNWALTPFLDGAKLRQPTLFASGSADPVLEFLDEEFAALENNVPNLWRKVLIPGAGHWLQQERPSEVNRLLLDFISQL